MVGREVALFLALMGGEVVPICRSRLAGAFLERCGLTCRYGSVAFRDEAVTLLEDCDLVADFSLPRGSLHKCLTATRDLVENCALCAPARVPLVYISSIMALGVPPNAGRLRKYVFAHTQYAALKRHGERIGRRSSKGRRPFYVLRLGQVHGELQGVSALFVDEIRRGPIYLPEAGEIPSYTVFCFTIAEALQAIAAGKEKPGTYTLVSSPPWTWREVYGHFSRRAGVALEIRPAGSADHRYGGIGGVARKVLGLAVQQAYDHRELIQAYGLRWFPGLETRIRAWHLRRLARSEIGAMESKQGSWPKTLMGELLGRRLVSLTDSRSTMDEVAEKVRGLVRAEPIRIRRGEGSSHKAVPWVRSLG